MPGHLEDPRPLSGQRQRLAAAALVGLGILLGAGCSDYERVLDVLFPPEIGGLPPDGAWLALPVGSWVTEGEVEATAMAACFARNCAVPAAVAAYRVGGHEAQLLDTLMADPATLARALADARRPPTPKRAASSRPRAPAVVSAAPVSEGAYRGLRIRMARTDGSHPAVGLLVSRQRGAERDALLVIARDEAAAGSVLRSVLAERP